MRMSSLYTSAFHIKKKKIEVLHAHPHSCLVSNLLALSRCRALETMGGGAHLEDKRAPVLRLSLDKSKSPPQTDQ